MNKKEKKVGERWLFKNDGECQSHCNGHFIAEIIPNNTLLNNSAIKVSFDIHKWFLGGKLQDNMLSYRFCSCWQYLPNQDNRCL